MGTHPDVYDTHIHRLGGRAVAGSNPASPISQGKVKRVAKAFPRSLMLPAAPSYGASTSRRLQACLALTHAFIFGRGTHCSCDHGGRQLDSVPSTARVLPEVVDAVGDRVEVLADGGVRTGLDVVKMVALGARAALIGRPWAWAVSARGEAGVRHVLQVMKADVDTALGLTGQTALATLDRSALYCQGASLGMP